jgi:hypothetical protein
MNKNLELLTIKEASQWATEYLQKSITTSNISYLIQYGRVKKIGKNGATQIYKNELLDYYRTFNDSIEYTFKEQNGDELNWSLFKGHNKDAKQNYIQGISDVLNNCKKYLSNDYNVFLVANDKNNMYPTIADNSEMQIVNQFKRPVLNRSEKDKTAYSETIFHLKNK